MEAVKQDWRALEYASADLQGDKDIVVEAVKQYGLALEYASADLKGNKDIVMEAVKQYGKALECASADLQNDKTLQKLAKSATPDRDALHIAAESGYWRLIESICRSQQSNTGALNELLTSKGSGGNMPLHLAARGGHRKACEMLFEHGAPHLAKNKARKRPQDLAREQPNSEAHRQVVAYFEELKNIFRTGGGSGNAPRESRANVRESGPLGAR